MKVPNAIKSKYEDELVYPSGSRGKWHLDRATEIIIKSILEDVGQHENRRTIRAALIRGIVGSKPNHLLKTRLLERLRPF